jgi:peroxiredoxin
MNVCSRIVTRRAVAAWLIVASVSPCLCRASAESQIGEDAKPFALDTVSGERVSLSDFLGKKLILVAFISISCFECDDMMPLVSRLMDAHQKAGDLQVLFVALANQKGAQWLAKSGKYDRRAPLLVEKVSGAVLPTADEYGVVATPSLTLIGRDGKIRWNQTGRASFETLDEEVKKALDRQLR